jgi:hypothetical protein
VSTAAAAAIPVALVAGFILTRPAPWNGELGPGYPGAGALADAALRVPAKPVLPPLEGAKPYSMVPAYWHDGCMVAERSATPKTCQFGDTAHPVKKVVIAGDSIAGNWMPALTVIAQQQHWELITELHALCTMSPTLQWFPNDKKPFTDCQRWGANVMRDLVTTIRPDLVITSGREVAMTPANHAHGDYNSAARQEVGDGIAVYWRELLAHGIGVLAIRETPEIAGMDVGACVLAHPGDYATACGQPTRQAVTPDPPSFYAQQQLAKAGLAGEVPEIDLDSLICGRVQCSPVEGNVLIFLDYHHMTDAYGKTLAQFLAPRLLAAVPGLRLPAVPGTGSACPARSAGIAI